MSWKVLLLLLLFSVGDLAHSCCSDEEGSECCTTVSAGEESPVSYIVTCHTMCMISHAPAAVMKRALSWQTYRGCCRRWCPVRKPMPAKSKLKPFR